VPVTVRDVSPQATYRALHASELSADVPSADAMQQLRLLQLDRLWAADRTAALAVLDNFAIATRTPRILATAAELALGHAEAARSSTASAALFLVAADRAERYLSLAREMPTEEIYSLRFTRTREVYNRAVAGFIELACSRARCDGREFEVDQLGERFIVRVTLADREVPLTEIDELRAAMSIDVRGLRNRYVRTGIGAALVAMRANDGRAPLDSLLPPEGVVRPVTALIHFSSCRGTDGDSARCAAVSLYDPRRYGFASIGGQALPLEADFTAPFAMLLAHSDLRRLGIAGLLDPARNEAHRGVFLMESYDPRKMPVVLIHGLTSSPLVWMEVTNELAGDPALRDGYQIWHYMYPSGLPFLYSSMLFRRDLEAARRLVDPDLGDQAMQFMVLIGHSMGGLIARAMVTDSDSALWDQAFSISPDRLRASEADLETLKSIFELTRLPYVGRVVFVATPHRGSELADALVGRLFSRLVSLPDEYTGLFTRVSEQNLDVVRPSMLSLLRRGGPTSIGALSPENPVLRTFSALPIAAAVQYHSIIGDRGRSRGLRSDGVVLYESAHLGGASSEVIFPASHAAASDPYAVAEMQRILHEQLLLSSNRPLPATVVIDPASGPSSSIGPTVRPAP
jgi:pimeloyl-ACP methyl ester carboxylesterase